MSTPDEETTPTATGPTVSTAPSPGEAPPARGRWHWSAMPDHLGRARTSTVVLVVLFLAIGTLYLNVRPETRETAPAGGSSDVEAPAQVPAPSEPAAPETTEEQLPTGGPDEETEAPTSTSAPGSTTPSTAPSEPTGTSTPTTGTTAPGSPAPTTTTAP